MQAHFQNLKNEKDHFSDPFLMQGHSYPPYLPWCLKSIAEDIWQLMENSDADKEALKYGVKD